MIDLSADLGEGSFGEDEIWPLITSANVACGGHVGDEQSMSAAVEMAKRHAVRLGAHPSYPDRVNFGRRSMTMESTQLRDALVAQLTSLRDIAARAGLRLMHAKPHGALYNDAHHDHDLARTIVEALQRVDSELAIVAPDRSAMAEAARSAGTPVIREAFADRRYEPDGSLVSRAQAGSLLEVTESAAQAGLLAREGVVIARDGSRIPIAFDTICIHADMEGAVERLRAVRDALRPPAV